MKKYKVLLEIVLKELQPTPKQIQEIIEKYSIDEHLSIPLKFYYKKSKKTELNKKDKEYSYTGQEVSEIEYKYEQQIENIQKEVDYWHNKYLIIENTLIKLINKNGE